MLIILLFGFFHDQFNERSPGTPARNNCRLCCAYHRRQRRITICRSRVDKIYYSTEETIRCRSEYSSVAAISSALMHWMLIGCLSVGIYTEHKNTSASSISFQWINCIRSLFLHSKSTQRAECNVDSTEHTNKRRSMNIAAVLAVRSGL